MFGMNSPSHRGGRRVLDQGAKHMADRGTPFSYRCNGCTRCCYKHIQLNPYEITRLAHNRGLDSRAFLLAYTEAGGSVLKRRSDNACVFLDGHRCSVHPDRPLVCRLYPLGRLVDVDGSDTFVHLDPDPETKGEYGEDGTVADFLHEQGAAPFMAAADRYLTFFHELVAVLKRHMVNGSFDSDDVMDRLIEPAGDGKPIAWYDIDQVVADYAAKTGAALPSNPEDKMDMHIKALRDGVSLLEKEISHAPEENHSEGAAAIGQE